MAASPGHAPLVTATRGEAVENVHYGSIAVVDATGRLLHAVGDPYAVTFTRSALKAFQALPFVLDGGDRTLGLTDRELALCTASHSGEPFHVEAVDGLLAKAGQRREHLRCGCHVPYRYEATGEPVPSRATFDERHHNCSGKHAGFLAYCSLHDLPNGSYLDHGHPLQRRIKRTLSEMLSCDEAALPSGVDGCSAPNHALPLAGLARLWAMLASATPDDPMGVALARLRDVMVAHPDHVSGTQRSDLFFAQAGSGDWIAKAGADGVQAIGIRSLGLGIAVKVSDGHGNARCVAAFDVLRQLGLCDAATAGIDRYARMPIRNIAGLVTGWMQPVFAMKAL